MAITVRNTARVLLINDKDQLLLMCVEDFDIASPTGKRNRRFWSMIGGKIEGKESVAQAALRETYEETGIQEKHITLGPLVWRSEIDLVLKGELTRFKESYIVAQTKVTNVALCKPSQDEAHAIKELRWFSFDEIKRSPDPIFPLFLPQYLPDILSESYPEKPLTIKLTK